MEIGAYSWNNGFPFIYRFFQLRGREKEGGGVWVTGRGALARACERAPIVGEPSQCLKTRGRETKERMLIRRVARLL
jgi:hypothetical protein